MGYEVSKTILCRHSAYVAAMFNGRFVEGTDQSAAAAGLVTSRSFKFQKEVEEIPEFGADVLRELVPLLVKASSGESCLGRGPTLVEFVDPFTQQR
ncbi:hypothetical protein ATETN484_0006040700 [Aspergillus terreus]|nr:hypothetical protein ATETN484_0006040700 [Aspergillus terreus]